MTIKQESFRTRAFANILVFIQFSSLGAIALLAITDFSSNLWFINIAFILIALIVVISAYRALKPSLSVNPIPREGAALIQTGIYRRIRHPMYVAVLLLGYGISGFSSNRAAIAIFGFLAIGIVTKAALEDNLLAKKHPGAIEYQKSTPGFIPCKCNPSK